MADVAVKPEIKVDPAEDATNGLVDIEEFDDDNELTIPDDAGQAWLVKVPSDMWQAWNNIYINQPDDTPVEIGTLRVYNQKPEEFDPTTQKIEIRLKENLPQHDDIPKNYNLKLSTNGYSNTVVFSEKDLAGHKAQPYNRAKHNLAKPRGIQPKSERYGRTDTRPAYRTAIPKQTRLAPIIQHEANAAPLEDEAYYAHLEKRWQASIQPKSKVIFTEGIDRGMHPGISNKSMFTTSSKPGGLSNRGSKKRNVKEKAVRMAQEDLLDALYKCFRQYRYWSLKALRVELKQPESYIRETLEGIATLVRSGDFVTNWTLNPHYRELVDARDDEDGAGPAKEEVAKAESGTDMGSDDELGDDGEDEDGEGFEDVKMEGPA